MLNKECRLGGLVLACLIGAAVSARAPAQQQAMRSGELQPASPSSPSAPYSPVVSFAHLPALQVATPIPGSNHVPGDFNGDGTSDLLWFNPLQSQVGYWTMNATPIANTVDTSGGVTRTGARTFKVTPGYFVGAAGDFNDDGYADLVFTSAKRDLWLWSNSQQGGFISTEIGSYPSQWQLLGAGDVDGDGYDDLLWLDPSDCKFAYWTMRGATRTGYQIMNVACGYYPIGIGYYTSSNRLSILWSSAAHDLYVWDSTGSGFVAYSLDPSLNGNFTNAWAVGGGYMGVGMGVESYFPSNGTGAGFIYSRTFDGNGHQTGFPVSIGWSAPSTGGYGSGGYVIEGNGVNLTGLYLINPEASTISVGGLTNSHEGLTGNAPAPDNPSHPKPTWTYPAGWYVVGAPVNGTAPLPWH